MSPRLLATAIAVPVALLTGAVVYNLGMPDPSSSNAAATSPVTLPAPALPAGSAAVCGALVDKLPSAVRTKQRRPVTAGLKQNAAYGDPAVTLQCGVPPTQYPATDDLFRLDTVCWHSRVEGDATIWTTVDRAVPVQVTVPGSPTGASQWTIVFSQPIAASVPALATRPSGCESLAEPIPAGSASP